MHMRRIAAATVMLVLLSSIPAMAENGNDADEVLRQIERILNDVEQAQAIVNNRHSHGDVFRAQEVLHRREAELERARIDAMAAATGVSRNRIMSLRAHGRTWYGIAADLGVSPRVVGLPAPAYAGLHGHPQDWHDWRDDHGHGGYYNKGKHKGWKHGMPPGQAKKYYRDDDRHDGRDDMHNGRDDRDGHGGRGN